jgi:CRP-like cAMP-binding protein
MESPVNLSNPSEPLPISTRSPAERLIPTLTDAQVARLAPQGRRRPVEAGEVLVEVGQKPVPFFVVTSGALQVVRPDADRFHVNPHDVPVLICRGDAVLRNPSNRQKSQSCESLA